MLRDLQQPTGASMEEGVSLDAGVLWGGGALREADPAVHGYRGGGDIRPVSEYAHGVVSAAELWPFCAVVTASDCQAHRRDLQHQVEAG